MENIQMVDLKTQYLNIKEEIDRAVLDCIASTEYINGAKVKEFQQHLEAYLDVQHVIHCANGTDALQIALMALGLQPGDEVIVPTFTYVATAEVIALLHLKPVMVDVYPDTFNISLEHCERVITTKTKAIVPVHLFGQSADMERIVTFAEKHHLFVIEDAAQAIGADYFFKNGTSKKVGTIGDIGSTSFFPSKNLGCYGDGGALFTNNDQYAEMLRMVANHGQKKKYYHSVVGVNSRLDTLQAAILDVKLKYLDVYAKNRQKVALGYDEAFKDLRDIKTPFRSPFSTHVFHQYTLQLPIGIREDFQRFMHEKKIPTMIYYPLPLYEQEAFKDPNVNSADFPVTNELCQRVISLPIHTEMKSQTLDYICSSVLNFFSK